MFFEKEILSFHILDVVALKQKNVSMMNTERNFAALSFRFRADTDLFAKGEEYHTRDNSVCFVPSRLDYKRVAREDDLIAVHFDAIDYTTDRIEHFIPEEPERLAALFRQLLELWEQKEIGYKYRCSAILYEILALCHIQNQKDSPAVSKIQASVSYMERHSQDPTLTVGEIAKQSFMSEVYFRKLFREEFGVSPQKYIISLRIQNAVGLIATGYYSLQEVARLSGYQDYKYFSVEFKRIMGVSPSEYLYRCPNVE